MSSTLTDRPIPHQVETRPEVGVANPTTLTAAGLVGVAAIHLADLPGKEPSYLAWMYVGAIIASLVLAIVLVFNAHRLVLGASGVLAASVLAGYVLNRTTGLPNATDDIGNWSEPLGMVSLAVEGATVAFAVIAMLRAKRR